ncbi:VanZ family protein [Neobacillus dielmonensis]|uniref:VanZ family protein n=1 Tax=Neobacillus dielmonensis TaxID=1347369 RepID=UPI0005A994FF|nr:VanZ family protein [Neobacillus dielmonensis]
MKWVLRVLPLVYMAIVFIQSSFPADKFVELPDSTIDHTIKESLHLIEFAILYVLLVLAMLTRRRGFTPALNVACAVFAGLYGISDEIHQSFYPYRSASWFDLVKDFTGIAVCYYFVSGALFKGKFNGVRNLLRRAEKSL